jgi:hypothetical protein
MISTILIWIYIFFITTLAGHFLLMILKFLIKSDNASDPDLMEMSMFGIIGIGIFLSCFSLFYKIGFTANSILISAGVVYFFLARRSIVSYYKSQIQKLNHIPVIIKVLIFFYFILILFAAQLHPTVSDTGLYHAQNIKWITNFKIVPGLGNLHGRFAFDNQSFLLEALFSLSFLRLQYFHLLNSYLMLILSVTLIMLICKTIGLNHTRSILYAGLLLLLQVFYIKSESSPTPDIFMAVGIWFIFITYFERIPVKGYNKLYWIVIIFTTFFLITVKLSALPVALIFVLFLLESKNALFKKLLLVSILGVVVMLPYFVRNYILSGYLIYPYSIINLFNPDWKIPVAYVNEIKSVISTHAQAGDWQQRLFSEWFPIWYSRLSAGFKILSVYILISPLLIGIIILFSRNIRNIFRRELMVLAICLVAIILWFFSAPNYRFIYPFLFVYLLITCMILLQLLSEKLRDLQFFIIGKKIFCRNLISIFFYALLIISPSWYILKFNYLEIKHSIVFPVDYEKVTINKIQQNDFQLNIPADGNYCWNSEIPCSIFQKDIGITNIELRGEKLEDGFRGRK